MELRRVAPGSAFKVGGGIYGAMGLLVGCLFSLFALVGAGFAGLAGSSDASPGFVGALFGLGAVIVLPILYGLMGAVMAALMAALYNLIARFLGGLELDLE